MAVDLPMTEAQLERLDRCCAALDERLMSGERLSLVELDAIAARHLALTQQIANLEWMVNAAKEGITPEGASDDGEAE